MARTPAMKVVLTAPRPTSRIPSFPSAEVMSSGVSRPVTISSGISVGRTRGFVESEAFPLEPGGGRPGIPQPVQRGNDSGRFRDTGGGHDHRPPAGPDHPPGVRQRPGERLDRCGHRDDGTSKAASSNGRRSKPADSTSTRTPAEVAATSTWFATAASGSTAVTRPVRPVGAPTAATRRPSPPPRTRTRSPRRVPTICATMPPWPVCPRSRLTSTLFAKTSKNPMPAFDTGIRIPQATARTDAQNLQRARSMPPSNLQNLRYGYNARRCKVCRSRSG